MSKYLDNDGLLYLWQKLKTLLAGKVDVVSGKGLSANDFTNELKSKLDGIDSGANAYTHPSHTAHTGKPTANATPAFGGTFTVSQIENDSSGHVTAMTDRTVTIPDTVFSGASNSVDGEIGLVPAPDAGDQAKFLCADGQWKDLVATDSKVDVTLATTTKAYITGTSATPVANGTNTDLVADTGVYLDTTAGKLHATSFDGDGASLTNLNGSNVTSGTVPAARLPAASSSAQGAMSAADYIKLAAFGSASDYALKSDITSMYRHKGTVATTASLPSTGNTEGDVYNVTATGMNYVWVVTNNVGAWDALGEVFTIDSITNGEIDTILAS